MVFLIALVVYVFTTPSGKEIQFTGIIMGNDYIASPLVQGRLVRLLVQEGSSVNKGQLIADARSTPLPTASCWSGWRFPVKPCRPAGLSSPFSISPTSGSKPTWKRLTLTRLPSAKS